MIWNPYFDLLINAGTIAKQKIPLCALKTDTWWYVNAFHYETTYITALVSGLPGSFLLLILLLLLLILLFWCGVFIAYQLFFPSAASSVTYRTGVINQPIIGMQNHYYITLSLL